MIFRNLFAYAELNRALFEDYLGGDFGSLRPDAAFKEVVQSNARFAALAAEELFGIAYGPQARRSDPSAILPLVACTSSR